MSIVIENSVFEIKKRIGAYKEQNKSIGFVPTMGALHKGHISLVNESTKNNDITIVSIFVNPTQFNDKKDLDKYPRDFNEDYKKLSKTKCNLIFSPDVNEMYPEPDNRKFNFGELGSVMEGEHRDGHFNGVAQVVSKLFEIIEPNNAYFGLKDFQQYIIIKDLVKQLNLNVNIIPCDTYRESDGLAMSSRNSLLTKEQREEAPFIYQTLKESVQIAKEKSVDDTKKWVYETINGNKLLKIEYFEIFDEETLSPVIQWDEQSKKRACIAVKMNNIRLIDNIKFNL